MTGFGDRIYEKECVQENKMEYRKEYNKDVMRE